MTYEIGLNQHEEEELKKKKEKGIALKADVEGESYKDSEEVESDLSDLEVAFLARMFRSFMRQKKNFLRKKNINRNEIEKEIVKKMPICYECNKLGHLRAECHQPSKEHKRKKKALMVAQDDSESSSSDDEHKEGANICLMAWKDEVHSDLHLDFNIDELSKAFDELMKEYKKLSKKRKETNLTNEKLNEQLSNISKEKDKLVLKN